MKLKVLDTIHKEPRKISIKNNGVWTEPKETWVNDNGVWKLIDKGHAVYELNAFGYDDTYRESYVKVDGVTIRTGGRGWSMVVYPRRHKFVENEVYYYDTHTTVSHFQTMANIINGLSSGDLVLIYTGDQPTDSSSDGLTNTTYGTAFYNAMRSSFDVTTSLANLAYRGSYMLAAHKFGLKYNEKLQGRYYTGDDSVINTINSDKRHYWGDYENYDFSQHTTSLISTTQTLGSSWGIAILPGTYTVPSLDKNVHLEFVSYFLDNYQFNQGQIKLGNRVVFEMGNEKSDIQIPTWDSVGNIIYVDNGTQKFYAKKIALPEPLPTTNNADDNGIWEIVKVISTNGGRLISTTNYYLVN